MNRLLLTKSFLISISFILFVIFQQNILAHCDGLDGPVVKAARKALETKNVNYVLIWVKESEEQTIRDVFTETLNKRSKGNKAKEMADTHFFEIVVKLHRQGEGEEYTGLKPAGRVLGPVIPAADLSIEKESFAPVKEVFSKKDLPTGEIEELFKKVIATKNFNPDDVESGRKFVDAYVTYLHHAEEAYENIHETHLH